jgi:FolB domain-containing protein
MSDPHAKRGEFGGRSTPVRGTDAIIVRGITAEGMHGLPGEREHPQPFVVDVEVLGPLGDAAAADDIEATIDYGVVAKEVRDVVMNDSYELVEALAEAVAARIISLGVNSVRVKVSKPRSAKLLDVDEIAIVVER